MKILLNYKTLLKKYGIKPSKRLGQNFLIDKSILKKIIETANLSSRDTVLEIGPGLGILTIELAKRAKQVIAVEKDREMCEILKEILEDYKNVKIINQDALSYKLPAILASPSEAGRASYKLIANLPYYITSPVIRKFLETRHKPKSMVLMVQKEVAQRIVARPPRMNLLTVAVQFYAKPKIISYVSKKSFWPQPKVDSAIIKIEAFRSLTSIDTKKFFQLVRTGFSSKRKMLKNNLQLDKSILEKIGIDPKTRAENLSISDWLKLYAQIHQK